MNTSLFYFLYDLPVDHPSIKGLVVFLAQTFPYVVALLVFIFLIFHHDVFPSRHVWQEFKKKWREILAVFLTGALAAMTAPILKIFIHTKRPVSLLPNIHTLISQTGYSFPSAHTAFFSAIGFTIFFVHRKAGYFFLFLALIIGVFRIMAGVHFPIDILGGFVLGYIIAYIMKRIDN